MAKKVTPADTEGMRWVPLLWLISCAIISCAKAQPGPNDVSVLWPLSAELAPVTTEMTGPYFFAVIPPLIHGQPDARDELRVVSARFDPCFRDVPSEGECRPQLRLVAQPLAPDGKTRDAAVHLFYRLNDSEVRAAVESLAQAHTRDADALTVNPTLLDQGPNGPYARLLRSLLDRYAVYERLVRGAFLVQHGADDWELGSFDVDAQGTLHPITIPNTSGTTQHMSLATIGPTTLETQRALEDPAAHGPGTVACASCHATMTTKLPTVRAFGYMQDTPAVSGRTVNETATVLRALAETR